MGVGRIFFKGVNGGEISFYHLETKKKNVFTLKR